MKGKRGIGEEGGGRRKEREEKAETLWNCANARKLLGEAGG